MALSKQPVSVAFAQGLNTKTDKWQIPTGQFERLTNTVFNKQGLLEKRNGYQLLAAAPSGAQTLSTLNDGIVALGNTCQSYSEETGLLTNAGMFQPMTMEVATLVRRATSQLTCDVAIATNGTACTTWLDKDGNSYYQVSDSNTGQIIVPAVQLPATANSSRTYALGQYFLVFFTVTVTVSAQVQYIAVPISNPAVPRPAAQFTTTAAASLTAPIDGQVYNNQLYLAFASADSGGAIHLGILTQTLAQPTTAIVSGVQATNISIAVDTTTNNVWLGYCASNTVSATVYNSSLISIHAPTAITSGISAGIAELTTSATNSVLTAIYEVNNTYAFAPNAKTDYIASNTLTQAGVAGTAAVVLRGVGVASRATISNFSSTIVFLATYGQSYQPTYLLVDISGNVLARLAYSNGVGYMASTVLPNLNQLGNSIQVGYLYADQLIPVNKQQNPLAVTGVYAQYGINLATFNFGGQTAALEIAGSLHPSGGMLWQYDGVKIREHGFNFWPEDIAGSPITSGGGLAPQKYYYQWCYEWTDAAGQLHRSAPSVPYLLDMTKVIPLGNATASMSISGATGYAAGDTTLIVPTITAGTFNVGQGLQNIGLAPNSLSPTTVITGLANSSGHTTITFSPAALTASGRVDEVATTSNAYTATFAANSTTITLNSVAGLFNGQAITDLTTSTNFQPGSLITAINTSTMVVTLSLPTIAASASGGDIVLVNQILSATINVPTLRQTYKTDNKVRIVGYRWSTNDQVYYQVTNTNSLSGSNPLLLNDTTVDSIAFTDVLNDQAIIGNNIIYTTGGVIENICAPAATSMVLWQSRLFMADAEDPNLIWYSKQVIEATPVEMSDLLTLYVAPTTGSQGSTGPITALGAMDNNLIVFKKDAIYYINGQGPDNTGAGGTFSDPVYITGTVGCINPFSVVLTPVGIMFQSDKGIWLLGRDLSTTYVGAEVEDYTDTALVTSATTVPGTNQVRFTLDNKNAVMYDYYFKLWGNWTNMPALSAVINDDLHTYLTNYGQIVQETPGLYLDISTPVVFDFTSGWFNLAGLQGFERFYSVNLLGQYLSPHKLIVEFSYDYDPGVSQTVVINPINYTGPYGSDPIYGNNTYGGATDVERWRIFPERQKCSSFKVTIKEIYDPSLGVPAGAGLSLSGMALLVGIKRGTRTQSANTSAG